MSGDRRPGVTQTMGWLHRDLALDIGGSTVRIHARGEGVVVSEPNVVALRRGGRRSDEVLAVGAAARSMIGRAPPDVSIVRPVSGGAVADFGCLDELLHRLIPRPRLGGWLRRPRMVVPIPFGLTEVERRAVVECAWRAGGREIRLIPKIVAAAIGMGLPVDRPAGHFVLDLGDGTTEMGVLSLSGAVTTHSARVGSAEMNAALQDYVRRKCNLLIGEPTAERLKLELGSAFPSDDLKTVEVRGRDLFSGVPRTVEIASEEAREALEEPVAAIVAHVRHTLEHTPPELSADVAERGIALVGGGSLLAGLDVRLREATGLPVIRADDPLKAVVIGAGRVLEDPHAFARLAR